MVPVARHWLRGAAVVPACAGTQGADEIATPRCAGTQGASPSPQPSPIKGEEVGNRCSDSLRSLERGTDKGGDFLIHTHLICHCEERLLIASPSRDVAISMRLNTRRRSAVATLTRLPRHARNDQAGSHEAPGLRSHTVVDRLTARPPAAGRSAGPALHSRSPLEW